MTLALNIVLALLGFASTLAAFGGEAWEKGNKPLLRRVTARGWVSLTCLFLALGIGIAKETVAHRADVASDLARVNAQTEAKQLRNDVSSQSKLIEELRNKLTESALEQAKYAARIETLTGETRGLVTGGRSYVWVLIKQREDQDGLLGLQAIHGGDEIPAFDVNVRFESTGRCDGLEEWTMGKVMATGVNNPRHVYLPAVVPNMIHPLNVRLKPSCEDAYYFAYIYTRNRVLFQQTLLQKLEGRWRSATRIVDLLTNETVFALAAKSYGSGVTWPRLPETNATILRVLTQLRVGNAQATGEQLNATKADAQAGANHKAISPLPVANESSMLGVMHQESSTNAEVRANGSEESGLVAPTWALVIATVALAVYTARLFRATVKLGDEAKRTSEQQRADTKESLEVSEAAAAAATKSADVAEKTLKVTQRGYLTLSRVKFEGLSAGQQPQRFMCATANKGNTPIRIVAKYLMRGVVDSLPDTPVLGAQADAVATPLAPGDDVGHNFTLDPLPESKLAEVLAGTKNFFIYGFFDYVDVFSEQHRMGFCFRYSLTAKELRQFGNEAYNYAT